jgi:hypothetical protein
MWIPFPFVVAPEMYHTKDRFPRLIYHYPTHAKPLLWWGAPLDVGQNL